MNKQKVIPLIYTVLAFVVFAGYPTLHVGEETTSVLTLDGILKTFAIFCVFYSAGYLSGDSRWMNK